jgi:hypothetical protein
MTKQEKLRKLQELDYVLFMKTKREVFDELDSKQTMFCCCGRLATGLHTSRCKKFDNKVISETIKRLEHLLK